MCVDVGNVIVNGNGSLTATSGTVDDSKHTANCGPDKVAVGMSWKSTNYMDTDLALYCQSVLTGWTSGGTGALAISGPPISSDNTWHGASCPTGTFISQIDVYASNYFDGDLTLFCRYIKPS